MMLARKWDRIENQCKANDYDIFKLVGEDFETTDGIVDDIEDLIGYLFLVMAYMTEQQGGKQFEITDRHGYEVQCQYAPDEVHVFNGHTQTDKCIHCGITAKEAQDG